MPALRREKWWLLFNLIALGAFILLASKAWLEPELKDVPGANGGAGVFWALTALPILLATFVTDLVWFGRAVAHAIAAKDRQPMWGALGCAAVWMLAVVFDQFHH